MHKNLVESDRRVKFFTVAPFRIEIAREDDGRWLAEIVDLPGVLAYGDAQQAVIDKVKALALRVIADRIERGEPSPEPLAGIFSLQGVAASKCAGGLPQRPGACCGFPQPRFGRLQNCLPLADA